MENRTPGTRQKLKNLRKACKAMGVKYTRQRAAIYKEVIQSAMHPDAETLFRNVKEKIPKISLDTVYRTLWLLKDLGLIVTLEPVYHRTRFDGNPLPHHHFICKKCRITLDCWGKEIETLEMPHHSGALGAAEYFQVNIVGLCAECTDNQYSRHNR